MLIATQTTCWLVAGFFCVVRAVIILSFRLLAKAIVKHDGYRRGRRERDAAVFLTERAPLP